MNQNKIVLIIFLFITVFNLQSFSQSRKAKKMYTKYEATKGTSIKNIPIFLVQMGASFTTRDPLVTKVVNNIDAVKVLKIPVENSTQVEEFIPGKKYNVDIKKIKSVYAKKCLWTVKEAHLVIYRNRTIQVISIYGHVSFNDLKKLNHKYLQNPDLINIPMLLQNL